jgi:hypothetical protein
LFASECHETLLKTADVVGNGSKFASVLARALDSHVTVAEPCHPPVSVTTVALALADPWPEHGGKRYGARYRPTKP